MYPEAREAPNPHVPWTQKPQTLHETETAVPLVEAVQVMKEVSKPITEVYERIVEVSGRVLDGLAGGYGLGCRALGLKSKRKRFGALLVGGFDAGPRRKA